MKQIKIKRKKTVLNKIFIKICRLLGYEIIDQSNLFLPVSNKTILRLLIASQNVGFNFWAFSNATKARSNLFCISLAFPN